MNAIADVKTVAADGPKGPTTAMLMAVNIGNPATGESFVSEIAERFKVHRGLSPPNTSMLLITLIGGLSADRFAARWRELAQNDDVMRAFMSLMQVADVVQGTKSGKQLSTASLLASGWKKPWWRFW